MTPRKDGFVYVAVTADRPGEVKVGRSVSPSVRAVSIQREWGLRSEVQMMHVVPVGGWGQRVEEMAHATLKRHRVECEWFSVEPSQALWAIMYCYKHAMRIDVRWHRHEPCAVTLPFEDHLGSDLEPVSHVARMLRYAIVRDDVTEFASRFSEHTIEAVVRFLKNEKDRAVVGYHSHKAVRQRRELDWARAASLARSLSPTGKGKG